MKYLLKFVLMTLALLMIVQFSYAWGTTGHRVVAEIAQRNLTKKAQRNLYKLMGKEPLAFWANWPDFIKSDTTDKWKSASPWHYVDVQGHISEPDFIQALKDISHKSLYSQIPAMEKQLADKSLSVEQRKIALIFLVHFIGDLEQPLHVGRPDDAGGNKITEYWFGKKTNLHSIWDSELIDFQKWSYTEYATVLNIDDKNQIKAIQGGSLEDWFYQSHQLADEVYDRTPANSRLSYDYNYIFINKLNQQLLYGGLRLAKVLNEILG